jgi:hypothetical protein
MSFNFLECRREQAFLPPDIREWLPESHLAFLILDLVDKLDLADFYASFRQDGLGAGCLRAEDDGLLSFSTPTRWASVLPEESNVDAWKTSHSE